jgi:hypothetical protein
MDRPWWHFKQSRYPKMSKILKWEDAIKGIVLQWQTVFKVTLDHLKLLSPSKHTTFISIRCFRFFIIKIQITVNNQGGDNFHETRLPVNFKCNSWLKFLFIFWIVEGYVCINRVYMPLWVYFSLFVFAYILFLCNRFYYLYLPIKK